MKRQTTIDAYHKIKENGLLRNLKMKVYSCLYEKGPMTGNELNHALNNQGNSGVYTTRLSELERMGCVSTIGKKKCKITGFLALSWDVTDNLPTKIEKRMTKQEKKKQILLDLAELWKLSGDSKNKGIFAKIGDQIKNI